MKKSYPQNGRSSRITSRSDEDIRQQTLSDPIITLASYHIYIHYSENFFDDT